MNSSISIYNESKALNIVGHQNVGDYLQEDFTEAIAAHRKTYGASEAIFDTAFNFYVLGVMCGKRAERAKRQHRDFIPFTDNNTASHEA